MRERLTEREDENRVEDPYTVDVFGHPLAVNGQLATQLEWTDPILREDPPDGDDRLLWESELEVEAFYWLGEPLAFFVQGRAIMEWDALATTERGVSDFFFERGETWVYLSDPVGLGFELEIGRIEFEDDRLFWWDEELDAIRLIYEAERWEIALAVARELLPTRSDTSRIAPDQQGRLRFFGELQWDVSENHALELYFLYEDDRSGDRTEGAIVSQDREDDSDAELWWVGPRSIGGFDLGSRGQLGYWLDVAVVFGEESAVSFAPIAGGRSRVEDVVTRDVFGFGFDAGATWFLPGQLEPRVSLGVAFGSGDDAAGHDDSFRQTGLQGNQIGFGGVQRFGAYGRLLDPELSNLVVVTAGAGISLLESSSLDLVYHYYRLVDSAGSLRDARLETSFDGRHRSVGQGLDLVLAIEESDRVQLELSASVFRAGSAWGSRSGQWAAGAFGSISLAF